jgi:hypothetical protein
VSIASASHTTPKPTHRDATMCSPSNATPQSNCRTGVRYCSRPIVDSGTRRTAAANNSSGTTVTRPAEINNSACHGGFAVSWPRPAVCSQITSPAASGPSSRVSVVSPARAPTLPPICFFTNPYSPNEAASMSAIEGRLPWAKVRTPTATAPVPTAAHCSGRSRSCSTTTPSRTVTSGLMK